MKVLEDFEIKYLDDNTLEDILFEGTIFDGGHHKQWYLMMALVKKMGTVQAVVNFIVKLHELDTYEEFEEEYGELDWGIPA